MKQLVLAIAGGVVVGAIVLFVLSLAGWTAGTLAGLSFSFHAGISVVWVVLFLAVQLGSGIAASWSAARFYRRHSWSAPLGASIGLAAIMAAAFLRGPSPEFVWIGLGMVALLPGSLVACLTGRSSNPGQEVA